MPDIEAVRGALPANMKSSIASESFKYASAVGVRPKQVQTVATDANYFEIKKFPVEKGRGFTDQEVKAGTPVGRDWRRSSGPLLPRPQPRRARATRGGIPFTVIGVIEKQGSVFGFSLDRLAIAPYHVAHGTHQSGRCVTSRRSSSQAPRQEDLAEGMEAARGALRGLRGLRGG
jgi:putative ABC transport system permease protein